MKFWLSGYKAGSIDGQIEINDALLRTHAKYCIKQSRLSWADIRAIDDSFKNEPPSGNVSNLAYLRDHNIRKHAGLHLCAILTGMRFFLSNAEYKVSSKLPGSRLHIIKPVHPQLCVSDGTLKQAIFPNPAGLSDMGLYSLQYDSSFGKWCGNYSSYMNANSVASPGRIAASSYQAINNYVYQIEYDSTLSAQDRDDVIAIIMLMRWVGQRDGALALSPLINANIYYDFAANAPDVIVRDKTGKIVDVRENAVKVKIRALLKNHRYYQALREACEILLGFGNNYNVSWMTYKDAYPDLP